MADRYWVGGTATWSSTNTTNWSTASNGAGGASVPTASDNVIFDANSNTGTGAFTVTVASGYSANCLDFTVTAPDGVMTLARGDSNSNINVYGSWSTPATNFSLIATLIVNFRATTTGKTIAMESNAKASGAVRIFFLGAGGGWTFTAEPLYFNSFSHTAGTVDFGNYNITCATAWGSTGSTARTLTLGSSIITITNTNNSVTFSGTNLTLNKGTSKILVTASREVTLTSNVDLYDVEFSGYSSTGSMAYFVGTFSVRDLIISTVPTGSSRVDVVFGTTTAAPGQITVTGQFKCSGSTDVRRRILFGTPLAFLGIYSTRGKIICNGTTDLKNVDFHNIDIEGTAAPISGTSIANWGGGVTGVTFTTAKTCYLRGTSGGQNEWTDNVWAASSGGSVDVANFPLGQDTVIIDNNTLSAELEFNTFNDGAGGCQVFDMSARTTSFTIDPNNGALYITGDDGEIIMPSNVTFATGTGNILVYSGSTCSIDIACTITRAGFSVQSRADVTFYNDLTITGYSTTDVLLSFQRGDIDLNGYAVTTNRFALGPTSSSSNPSVGSDSLTFSGGSLTIAPGNTTSTDKFFGDYSGLFGFPDSGVIRFSGNSTLATVSAPFALWGNNSRCRLQVDGSLLFVSIRGVWNDVDMDGLTARLLLATATIVHGDVVFGADVSYAATLSTTNWEFRGSDDTTFHMKGTNKIHVELVFLKTDPAKVTLLNDVGSISTVFLNSGGLNLNGYDIECIAFSTYEDVNRTLDVGSPTAGEIRVTGVGPVDALLWGYGSKLSVPNGRPTVRLTANPTTGTRSMLGAAVTEASAPNIKVEAGTDTISGSFSAFNLDFTGFSGTFAGGTRTYWGDVTLSSTMTVTSTSSITTFGKTSGTQVFTTNGVTFAAPMTKSGAGTLQLGSALNLSTRDLTVSAGTMDDGGYNITAGALVSGGSTARTLAFNGGTWTLTSTSAAASLSGSNLTTSGSGGTMSLTGATSKTFSSAGFNFSTMTLNQGGAGTLTVTGSNTFRDWSATQKPSQFTVTAGSTQTFVNFTLSGSAGSLVTLRSSVGSSSYTFSKAGGVVNVDYLDIQRSTATGGAAWYAGVNSTNSGNNSGWIFTAAPAGGDGKFFAFFNWA